MASSSWFSPSINFARSTSSPSRPRTLSPLWRAHFILSCFVCIAYRRGCVYRVPHGLWLLCSRRTEFKTFRQDFTSHAGDGNPRERQPANLGRAAMQSSEPAVAFADFRARARLPRPRLALSRIAIRGMRGDVLSNVVAYNILYSSIVIACDIHQMAPTSLSTKSPS